MQEIINRINVLSLEDTNEKDIEVLLNELISSLIQNTELSQSILNKNLIETMENWMEFESITPTCLSVLEISLTNYKILNAESFNIIHFFLTSNKQQIVVIGIRKLQQNTIEISSLVPKSTVLSLITCLNSLHSNIGPPAINLLVEFLDDNFLEDADVKNELKYMLETSNTEILCRLYEVCVGVGIKQYSRFEKIKFIIDKLLNDLNCKDDVLLKLNLLEILQSLCQQDYSFSYLESKDVLKNLTKRVEQVNEDPLNNLLLPGIMKFFGAVAVNCPQKLFRNYFGLFDSLLNCTLADEPPTIYSALDTLGHLSKFNECKKYIDQDFEQKFAQVLSHIYEKLASYSSDMKKRVFNCLECAFSVDDPEMLNNQTTYICEKWCNSIFENNNDFSTLLSYCKTPFDDIALAAFGFLKSLAIFSFGQRAIANSAGFIEFLLDRKLGISFEVKQKKYEIIDILSKSDVFDGTTIAQFSKYVREGTNFVEPQIILESS